ncbi:MAG: acyl-CoA dehydrogenase family protein [Halieaceae bacterium]|nr:acyl-CoA dehydrogenase family protein [Halieaceae bacterium]
MHISLSEEQQLLKDGVARFVEENYSIEQLRALRDSGQPLDVERWQQLAELGWLALPFDEADGGFGGSAIDLMVLMEEFGRGLVTDPYLANVVVCGGFLRAAQDTLRSAYLPGLIAGESQWGFAFAEPRGRFRLHDVSVTAEAGNGGYRLQGEKIAVLNGEAADYLLVTARTSGDRRDRDGISLLLVPGDAPGLSRTPYPLVDGSRGASLHFDNVEAGADAVIGEPGNALLLVEDVIDQAIVAMAAEALGAMDMLLEQTVEYTRTREQFGQPISRFQALQHRMADMYLECQSLRSLLYYAAILRDEGREDAGKAASALKVKLEEAGRFVSQQAVQLHGGIGMTDELGISHYFKRLLLLNTLFGDGEHHLRRYLAA